MGSITGHKIDSNGAGALRGQRYIPSKTEPKYAPGGPGVKLFLTAVIVLCRTHYNRPSYGMYNRKLWYAPLSPLKVSRFHLTHNVVTRFQVTCCIAVNTLHGKLIFLFLSELKIQQLRLTVK